ncbi:MAG TPA: hypothetical protein VKU79_04850 [Thermoplasmataceae archaeon]|nr:hypothetical protein [Thermoplasmatales archaeon AK]HLH86173.1 hypothetical protein [Thermoplasmataceae archaeon]
MSTGRYSAFTVANVLILVFLSIQAWAGDVVNLFGVYPSVSPKGITPGTYVNLILSVKGIGPLFIWHELEAIIILVLGIILVPLALARHRRSLTVCSILGLFFIISAIIGGLLFVLSGFSAQGSSAQMGGSFIGAYAMYFLLLYYAKTSALTGSRVEANTDSLKSV